MIVTRRGCANLTRMEWSICGDAHGRPPKDTNGDRTGLVRPPLASMKLLFQLCGAAKAAPFQSTIRRLERGYGLTQAVGAERLDVVAAIKG